MRNLGGGLTSNQGKRGGVKHFFVKINIWGGSNFSQIFYSKFFTFWPDMAVEFGRFLFLAFFLGGGSCRKNTGNMELGGSTSVRLKKGEVRMVAVKNGGGGVYWDASKTGGVRHLVAEGHQFCTLPPSG